MEITLEDLQEWQEALTSGKFRQIDTMLHAKETHPEGAGMCCLGVFCYLQKDKLGLEVVEKQTRFTYDLEAHAFPLKVQTFFHCNEAGCRIPVDVLTPEEQTEDSIGQVVPVSPSNVDGRPTVSPMGLNDYHFTFSRIAELLPYGCIIIDNYTDRNVIKEWGEPLSGNTT